MTYRASLILLTLSVLVFGCSDPVTVERAEPTTTEPSFPTTGPAPADPGLDAQTIDTLFVANVRNLAPAIGAIPGPDLIEAALAICLAFDSGATFTDVALTAVASGFPPQSGGVLIGSAVAAYCDEYLGLLG